MSQPTSHSSDDQLKHHTYDGIQEFDKRLPNWWLWTLHGAIIFALAYWFFYHWPGSGFGETVEQKVERDMAQIALAAASGGEITDTQLWTMSRNDQIISAGRATFQTTCVSCHGQDMMGREGSNKTLIGANLISGKWIHGGNPTQIMHTVTTGVTEKGMPTWGPVLGKKRITEVVAYVLSHHKPPE